MRDREGNLWFGAFPEGTKIDPRAVPGLTQTPATPVAESTTVYSFYEDAKGFSGSTQVRFIPVRSESEKSISAPRRVRKTR